jgi:hypothetical protein
VHPLKEGSDGLPAFGAVPSPCDEYESGSWDKTGSAIRAEHPRGPNRPKNRVAEPTEAGASDRPSRAGPGGAFQATLAGTPACRKCGRSSREVEGLAL